MPDPRDAPERHETREHGDASDRGDVTVVIATRDRCDELARTLARLRALPERPPVVVVDNASSDGTACMVRTSFPGVRLEVLSANRGAPARNVGVRAATTPYVAFSDDDSWWDDGALPAAARVMDAHPRLGLLMGRIHLDGDDRVDPVSRKMAGAPAGRDPDLPGPAVIGFPACAAVVRRDAFLRVGGFDELLFFGGEESLLALDLAAAGWGLAYVDSVTLVTWMRLSYPRALRSTRELAAQAVYDAAARRALRDLAVRLPAALARRRRVPAAVERRLRALRELE